MDFYLEKSQIKKRRFPSIFELNDINLSNKIFQIFICINFFEIKALGFIYWDDFWVAVIIYEYQNLIH